jgi:hypothetical protein
VVITSILYYDEMLPLLITAVLDGLLLIASIVAATLIGKPLPMLNCSALPPSSSIFVSSLVDPLSTTIITKTLPYSVFVALDQPTCFEVKAVWGLAIALCVLFGFSALVCLGLWNRTRREAATDAQFKDIEG